MVKRTGWYFGKNTVLFDNKLFFVWCGGVWNGINRWSSIVSAPLIPAIKLVQPLCSSASSVCPNFTLGIEHFKISVFW